MKKTTRILYFKFMAWKVLLEFGNAKTSYFKYYKVQYIIFEFIDLNQFISLLPHYRRTPLPSIVPVSYVAETLAQKCLKYLDEILQHVPDIAIFPIKRSNHYKIALSQFPKAPMGTKATPHSNSISVCNVRI